MKLLQRLEMKEATEFFNKITNDREVQDKKFEQENQVRDVHVHVRVHVHVHVHV